MKKLALILSAILLCGFTYGYKNNPQTGKPDIVVTAAATTDISGCDNFTTLHIGTANGLSMTAGHTLNLQAATNSVPGALTAADHTTFAAKEPAITAGTTAQYLRGDKSLGTLNQAAVAGLTTADIPTFRGMSITTGSNASAGTGTLSGGTATINTTAVTADSLIFLTDTNSGIVNLGVLTVSAISAGTSFTVKSSNALDASTFNWFIIN